MYRQILMAAVAITSTTVTTTPAVAQLTPRAVEAAVESNTEIVSLPDSIPADLGFQPCGTCSFRTLRMDETARLFIGTQQVSLSDLRRYANRGSTGLDVFYDEKTRLVTRIILRTELDAADAARLKGVGKPAATTRKIQ